MLGSRCEYFSALFETGFSESTSSKIEINDISYPIFFNLCEHMYSDDTEIKYENIFALMQVSEIILIYALFFSLWTDLGCFI